MVWKGGGGDLLGAVEFHTEDEFGRIDALPDFLDDTEDDSALVFEGAAILVCSLVDSRGQELRGGIRQIRRKGIRKITYLGEQVPVSTVQLRTIRSGLVQRLRCKRPTIHQIINLLERQRPRLCKRHPAHGRRLDIARGDGVSGHVFGYLTAAVGELADTEGAVGFGGGDDGFEGFDGVP